MTTAPLYSVEDGTSARAVARLIAVLFPDATAALDMTYGSGRFWDGSAPVAVTGLDINPSRARDVCGDFTRLPFVDGAFDLAIFDPPYHTDMGRGKASVMGARFGTYPTLLHLENAVKAGAREAWRVSRLGILVKVQTYVHASRLVRMTRWVEDAVPADLYDEMHLKARNKILDPKWGDQLSVYRNHATFLAFRKDGATHKRRRVSA